ncbi:MAG: photosystem II stability/assembly factor-like uncharacterized protein, partial [Cellvibrionaceae bacterium]
MRKILLLTVSTGLLSILAIVLFVTPEHSTYKAEQLEKPSKTMTYEQYIAQKSALVRAGNAKADDPEMHGIIQRELRTKLGDEGPTYRPNQVMEEFQRAKKNQQSTAARTSQSTEFVERGPGNVAGRTRGLLVDPDDANRETFYAGAASGGIWKTTDAGGNWSYISGDIPNLGTNTLAMSAANSSVIYAGTGEHFTNDIDGAGMFKSMDKGASWVQIADPTTMPDFKNVSRIVVDPNDEDVVIATTRSTVWGAFSAAIYKTVNGGTTWTRLRSSTSERYDDIDYDPTNFNVIYVAVNGRGVIKSTDGGTTWMDASEGISAGGRLEITISPVNPLRLWASVQGSLSGTGSDLYVSSDGATTWSLAINATGANEDFLGGQGWYDNIATSHPFDQDIVYVGGVNTWKFELTGEDADDVRLLNVDENGTDNFMSYVNFGGGYLGGGMDLGDVPFDELLIVEVRFGQGTQLAHRFTVGGEGPGVPAGDYLYQDYVEVPFQAWDVLNNKQLMVSFRDQQEDGAWNLIPTNTDGATADHSREYFYVHKTDYADTANSTIAINGGQEVQQMYFFWPVLVDGSTFDPVALPNSELSINFDVIQGKVRTTTSISDAYGQFSGPNGFPQSARTAGLHPDQHNYLVYDVNQTAQTFRLLIGNDGGVYRSNSSSDPGVQEGDFEYISYGYNTTQFYGADKAPGENRYIGGMQDNGTWYHVPGTEGGAAVDSRFAIGGDGFEVLWHSADPNKIIGGSQFNNFARTLDGGSSWQNATSGFEDDGPFITRLAASKQLPERIFTVGTTGVWYSTNFGGRWIKSTMTDASLWSFSNSADVEVSYANPDIIWAGAALSSAGRLHYSTDGGSTFSAAENYDEFNMGGVSGFATHPSEDSTAYALYSFAGFPKVIRTTDLGQTWDDISGFDGTGSASTKGFPDVAVNCLFVFPDNPNKIWVGSEIGIIESLDNGATWGLMDNNMPPVNVYDFKLADNQLVIATYGRGIWSITLDGIVQSPVVQEAAITPDGDISLKVNFAQAFDSTQVFAGSIYLGTIFSDAAGAISTTIANASLNGFQKIRLEAYLGGVKYNSIEREVFLFETKEASSSFGTNFKTSVGQFIGYGFRVNTANGFSNNALNSEHPYGDNAENIYYLKTPIIVNAENAVMIYEDVAIVEPGEPGTVYGNEQFWDYVVVEATKDGLNWVPLEDGYDASLHPEWLAAYDAEEEGTRSLFKDHSIILTDHFDAEDKILIRFRLFADANVNGFGWVIDNLYIQEAPLALINDKSTQVNIYP